MISIVNGYIVPLKQEHVDFPVKILLPLDAANFLHVIYSEGFIAYSYRHSRTFSALAGFMLV
jgi:hypothetical protein